MVSTRYAAKVNGFKLHEGTSRRCSSIERKNRIVIDNSYEVEKEYKASKKIGLAALVLQAHEVTNVYLHCQA